MQPKRVLRRGMFADRRDRLTIFVLSECILLSLRKVELAG